MKMPVPVAAIRRLPTHGDGAVHRETPFGECEPQRSQLSVKTTTKTPPGCPQPHIFLYQGADEPAGRAPEKAARA